MLYPDLLTFTKNMVKLLNLKTKGVTVFPLMNKIVECESMESLLDMFEYEDYYTREAIIKELIEFQTRLRHFNGLFTQSNKNEVNTFLHNLIYEPINKETFIDFMRNYYLLFRELEIA